MGEFDVEGRVLVVPLNGHGNFYANVCKYNFNLIQCTKVAAKLVSADNSNLIVITAKCEAHAILKGKLVDVDNVRYLNFVSLDLKIDIDDYNIRLDNLFQGDEVLSE